MTRHSNHGLGDGISMLGILCASQLDLLCDQPQISPDIQKMSGPFSPYLPVVVGLFAIACPFHRHWCLHYNLVAIPGKKKRESTKHQKEKKTKPRDSLSQKVTKIFICLHHYSISTDINSYINSMFFLSTGFPITASSASRSLITSPNCLPCASRRSSSATSHCEARSQALTVAL